MTMVADTTIASRFLTEAAETETAASLPFQREISRLTDTLLPIFSVSQSRCIHLLDIGDAEDSSTWLSAALGSSLGVRLKTEVHVLCLGNEQTPVTTAAMRSKSWKGCVVEHLTTYSEGRESATLADRLSELQAANRPVLLYSAERDGLPETLLRSEALHSVVLLAHASRTRRAALQATVQRLELTGTPLLGCVLLDRKYPIPEKLYHLL